MSYMLIAELVVVGVPLGCVVVWTMRAVIPARAEGQSTRLHDRQWFLDLFRQGFAMVRRCSWIVLIPAAAELASLNLQLGYWYAVTRTGSPPPGGIPRVNIGALARILRDLPTALPFSLLRAAKDMTAALLCGGSWPVMFLGAAVAGLFLLRPVTVSSEAGQCGLPRRRNVHFRAAAGLLCLCMASAMVFVFVWMGRGSTNVRFLLLCRVLFAVPCALVQAIVATTLLVFMMAAAEGDSLTLAEAGAEVPAHVRPVALFCLVVLGLRQVVFLPSYVQLFWGTPTVKPIWLSYTLRAAPDLCLLAISFTPFFIVLQPSSLPGGLSRCARLWARHWRDAAVLVGIGALLLLVPVICTRYLHWLLPRPAGIGLVLRILASFLRITLSALISCSMMAFCKAVLREEAEARPVPEIPVDVPTQNGKNGSALI